MTIAHPLNCEQSEALQQLRQQTQSFVEEHIKPLAASADRDSQFPEHLWKRFAEQNLLGMTVDPQYGGTNMGYLAHAIVMEEISRGSAGMALSYGAHSNLCVSQLVRYGNDEQKQRFLPKLTSGQLVGALAMSEPDAGSDIMSMQLRAEREGDVYRLNGQKMWITNGPDADVIVVYASTQPELKGKGLTAFIIEKSMVGFSTGSKLDKLGMRSSNTAPLYFKDCIVPAANRIGEEGEGAKILMNGLNYERVILAAGPVGIMQACIDCVVPYVSERKQFGQPIGHFQLVQGKLADMYTTLNAARAFVYSAANACDKGLCNSIDAASVILYAAENATRMALDAIQLLGGNGYLNDFVPGRLLRDAKLYEIGAGTSEVRRLVIGRELVKQHSQKD
jgi:isovaleryl-CoA dehydrogenase